MRVGFARAPLHACKKRMHPMPSFRLSPTPAARTMAPLTNRSAQMNTSMLANLDDILFALAVFLPVSVLLAGSFPLAALGAI
jgi:hypothetical protein